MSTQQRHLWLPQHKYDVGLKNAELLGILVTLKSDKRPHKTQYPLKPEAVEGITQVEKRSYCVISKFTLSHTNFSLQKGSNGRPTNSLEFCPGFESYE